MKRDDSNNNIRLGNGEWDFKDFFPRTEEKDELPKNKKGNLSNDPFTRAFLSLDMALKRHEEKNQTSSLYPFANEKEQQGIFLMDNTPVNIYQHAFAFHGASLDTPQKEYLHAYARELRKFVTEMTAFKYNPVNQYFANVTLRPNPSENIALHMHMACSMDLDGLFWCYLVPLQDTSKRVIYQVIETLRDEVCGAGFLYTGKKGEIDICEIKVMELF